VVRHTYNLIYTALSLIFIGSMLLLVFEESVDLKYHDYMYFMVVTMSTVGFGDVSPVTDLGRFCVILTITTMLAVLPP
jgi:voltage-gated potassium channel